MRLEYITISVLVIFAAAFAYTSSTGNHEWGGADDKPEAVIDELTGGSYHPWAQSIWTPPSGEIESLLFALQAAFGSIIIGYFIGYYRGLAKARGTLKAEEQEGNLNARSAR
jgi:cobalt/nickel transport protein